MTAIGSSRRPACHGDAPSPAWKSCANRNRPPKSAAYIPIDASVAAENDRLRKKRNGSIGAGDRCCATTKTESAAMPPASAIATSGRAQPPPARMTAQTTPVSPTPLSTMPGTSMLRRGPWLSSSRRRARPTSATPSGMLIPKTHRQPSVSVRPPPTTGPSAAPRPPIAPHAPSTVPRRSAGVAAPSRVSATGAAIAAPPPCTALAATSIMIDGASTTPTEPAVNTASPTANIRRLPKRSPSAAPASRSTANESV